MIHEYRVFGLICSFILLVMPLYGQVALSNLSLLQEDVVMSHNPQGGFDLFIRKKTDLASVLLIDSSGGPSDDAYAYHALEWNPVNGAELRILNGTFLPQTRWFLVDSTPEPHPVLGEALHIYIPPIIYYGYENTRHGALQVQDGVYLKIRTFALPHADYRGAFQDNRFLLRFVPKTKPDPEPQRSVMAGTTPEPEVSILVFPDMEDLDIDQSVPEPVYEEKVQEPEVLPPPEAPVTPSVERPEAPAPLKPSPLVFRSLINAKGGVMVFHPGPEGVLSETLRLQSQYDPIGSIALTQNITKLLGINVGFERDSLLMNRFITRAAVDLDFLRIEAGPYFGLFNPDPKVISPGLSTLLQVKLFKGLISGSFQFDSPLGRKLDRLGDYTQGCYAIDLGFRLPFGMLNLGMSDRTVTKRIADAGTGQWVDLINTWVRYNLALEFSFQNKPFAFRLNGGYQELQWIYATSRPLDYTYFNVYVGLEASYRILPNLKLFLGAEAPVYPWVYPTIGSLIEPQEALLYGATLGILWTIGAQP